MNVNPKLKQLLGKVFDAARSRHDNEDRKTYERLRWEFVFHMTDWLTDLKELNNLYEHPEKAKVSDATTEIIGILYHVVPHLNAAGRLLLDEISDPFAEAPRSSAPGKNASPDKVKRRRQRKAKAG